MTPASPDLTRERLRDIVDYCTEAAEIVAAGRTAFDARMVHRRAAEAIINRIGTTVAHGLPPELLVRYPDQPWEAIKGMRNRVVHEYRQMDWDLVWSTLERDLPALSRYAVAILRDEPSR